jgi:hypothetical protein
LKRSPSCQDAIAELELGLHLPEDEHVRRDDQETLAQLPRFREVRGASSRIVDDVDDIRRP